VAESSPIYMRHVYSVGSVADIVVGKTESLTTSLGEAKNDLIAKTAYSAISAPNVIGAYLVTLVNPSFKNVIPRNKLEEMSAEELQDIFSQSELVPDIGLNPHPFLAQIGYDSKFMPREMITPFLNDISSRIRIFPYNEMNTESEQIKQYLSEIEVLSRKDGSKSEIENMEAAKRYFSALQGLLDFGGLDSELDLLLAIQRDVGINPRDFL